MLSNTDKKKKLQNPRGQPRRPRSGSWLKRTIALLLLVFSGYAAIHVSSGMNQGCNLNTVLKTMTPFKELYLKPKLDSELIQSPEARSTGLIFAGDIVLIMKMMDLTLSDCLHVEVIAEQFSLDL